MTPRNPKVYGLFNEGDVPTVIRVEINTATCFHYNRDGICFDGILQGNIDSRGARTYSCTLFRMTMSDRPAMDHFVSRYKHYLTIFTHIINQLFLPYHRV